MTKVNASIQKFPPVYTYPSGSRSPEKLLESEQKDVTDNVDMVKTTYFKRNEKDLLTFLSANTSKFDFDNFGKIRKDLSGRDKTLFEMSALRGYSMLGDLNSLFRYYDLSSQEATSFLDAFSELDEDEMEMLIDIRKSYGGKGFNLTKKYGLASALSLLREEDQANFVRALSEDPEEIERLYELTFAMTHDDRSDFLEAAANSGSKLSKFLDATEKFGGSFLKKADMSGKIFVGFSNEGDARTLLKFKSDGTPVFDNNIYENALVPEKYFGTDTASMELFSKFLSIAEHVGESVDDFLKLLDRFDLKEDKLRIFSFIEALDSKDAQNFTDAAAGLETSQILNLIDRTKTFSGKDRNNFLTSAANADDSYSKFIKMLGKVGDDMVSKFLSSAAKSGENIDQFLDMASEFDNKQLEEFLDFMEELSDEQAEVLLEEKDLSGKTILEFSKETSSLDQKDKDVLIDIILDFDMELNELVEQAQNKPGEDKKEFFLDLIDTFHEGVDEIM